MTEAERAWREVAVCAESYIETLVELRVAQDKVIDLFDAGQKVACPTAWRLVVLGRESEVRRVAWQAATTHAKIVEDDE